ncbi:MAG: hypothetical protein H6586_03105 [Flavobacteriales bacterium]|nr:hypothetical protein [Flavobacteriales bacterium]
MRYLLLGILFLIHYSTFTQNYVDLAKISYAISPFNEYKDDSLNILPPTQIIEFSTDLTVPIVLKNNKVIISGLIYEQINLRTENSDQLIYTINPKMGIKFKSSEKFSSTYIALPKLSSDLENIDEKHFQFGAIALYELTKNTNFKYKFGLYYNSELFGPFFVPLLGFYYLSNNKKFEANFTLPVSAQMNYKLNKWLSSGVSFSSFVKTYHLGDFNNRYLVKYSNEIFATLQLDLKSYRLVIEPQVGYSVARSYRMYASDDQINFGFSAFKFGDDRTQLNNDFNDGLIFKIRLLYRFVTDNN